MCGHQLGLQGSPSSPKAQFEGALMRKKKNKKLFLDVLLVDPFNPKSVSLSLAGHQPGTVSLSLITGGPWAHIRVICIFYYSLINALIPRK